MKVDVGCGGTMKRAAKGFDVYTDVIHPSKADVPGQYIQCPMEKMPFKDKEFIYARCHHVVEHTEDPDKACKELVRIAEEGIISFPPMQAEIMFGRKDLIKKRHDSYGIPRRDTGCELNVDFQWKGSFEWQVVQ
jgi:hypothetical protein